MQEPHCQIIVLLSHSAQSKVDKDQLPVWTGEGLTLLRIGLLAYGKRLCDSRHKLVPKSYFKTHC